MRSSVAFVVLAAVTAPSAQDDAHAKLEEQVARVEAGLSLPVVIRGEPRSAMRLADRLAFHHVPGLALAVIEKGEIAWTKGYGVVEAGTEQPVTANTLFQTASIGKPLAAFIALRLVEQGELELDAPVNERLESWKIPENEFTRRRAVTLRHILSHSAGFNVGGVDCYWPGEPLPTLLEVLQGKKPEVREAVSVQSVPGTRWEYSGGGYTVLEQLLVDVSRRSYAELARETLLGPLGMERTFFDQPLTPEHEKEAAVGHQLDGRPFPGRWRVFPTRCPGGAWSTAADTARLACEILAAAHGRSELLSRSLADEMLKKQSGNWGLGLQLQDGGRSFAFLHTGHNDGYRCVMVAFPSTDQGAVVLTNGDGAEGLCFEVLRAVASAYDWPGYRTIEHARIAHDSALFPRLTGRYALTADTTITISSDGERLLAHLPPVSDQPVLLIRESATTYFILEDRVTIDFVGSDRGPATEAFVTAPGNQFHAKRLDQ